MEGIPMSHRNPISATALTILLAAGWMAGLVVPPVLLLRARSAWLEKLESPEAQAQWDEFREDMKRQSGRDGPVQRKVPKSVEPPLKVWLRDYVWLAISAWAVLGGVLGFVAVMLGRGALLAQDEPARGGNHEKQDQGDAENAQKRKHGG
jgi:hypothetical protein